MLHILPVFLALLVGPQTGYDSDDAVRQNVARVLAKTRDPIELRRSLVFLGKNAIPPLFEVWLKGYVPLEWRSDAGYVMTLNDDQLSVVMSAFGSLPEGEVYGFLGEIARTEESREVRIKTMELVGEIGNARALRLLALLATPLEVRNGVIPRSLRFAFGAALQRLCEQDVITTRHLRELFVDAARGLMATIVQVLSEEPGPEAARSLAALLGRQPKLDPLILAKIAARERSENSLDDEDLRTAVRSLLNSSNPLVLASAARASGILVDEKATEDLVALVDHRDSSVRRNASDALKHITGLGFGQDGRQWSKWFDAEMDWWEDKSRDVLVALETAVGVDFYRALVSALKRRLFRDRIAASLVLRLRDRDPDCVRLACAALAQLRAQFAVGDLIGCLENQEIEVREAAWKALRAITGKDLPMSYAAWAEAPRR